MKVVENDWGVDALDKSYQQGYMKGMVGELRSTNPYKAEIIAEAWEAGWQDGNEKRQAKLQDDDENSETA